MILADTSVWVNHFREALPQLSELVERQILLIHPMVIGELCMGSLKNRTKVAAFLDDLPLCEQASHDEVRGLVERERLYSLGLSYIDAHLMSSALITPDCQLWTVDHRLLAVAERLERAAKLLH